MIALHVGDRLGAARRREMVCSGVPFAQGKTQPDDPWHVETSEGQPLPTQTKVLGSWPDGSVKWLLVQFPADCPANSQVTYQLVPGPPPTPPQAVNIDEDAEAVTVNTGALRLTVPKDELSTVGEVWELGEDGHQQALSGGTHMTFTLADGTTHSTSGVAPESVQIEESGPLRATVRVVGWLEGPDQQRRYKLDTRLRFYADQSYIKAEYTFICLSQPELHHIKEISVDLKPLVGDSSSFVLPGENTPTRGELAGGQAAVLLADADTTCSVGIDGDLTEAGEHLNGWALVRGDRSAFGLALRDFWQLCPKAIEVSSEDVKIALWSARSGQVLNLGRTRAKTHHILYDFSSPQVDEQQQLDRVRAFQEPALATTEPEYLSATDALGPLSPFGAEQTAKYDHKLDAMFRKVERERNTLPREASMLHYGDYFHGGYGNVNTRGDLEYDTGHGCFQLYARSGDRDYFDFAVACNQHLIDIDVNHETGEQRFHGYNERAESHEAVTTGMEWGHLFVDCCADAYYLTGDERSLQALRGIADVTAMVADGEGHEKIRDVFSGAERQLGLPLRVLCRAYEITRDDKYLQAATKIVEYIKLYAQAPIDQYMEGKWVRCWMMDGCKVFMTGLLNQAFANYWDITRDEGLLETVVTGLDWLIDHMWQAEHDGFSYEFNAFNREHRRRGETRRNMLAVGGFRFGYELTRDRRYLAVAMRAFRSRVQEMEPSSANQFSQDANASAHTAAYFYREDLNLESPPLAPMALKAEPAPPPTGPRPDILLQASFDGDLSYEGPGGAAKAEVVGNVPFVSGKQGQALRLGEGYVRMPVPPDLLRRPGSIELWLQPHFKTGHMMNFKKRAVFHIEGENPLIDSLGLVSPYYYLHARLKNHIGHLDGSAQGITDHWEPGQWHHVVVTWDRQRVRLYLDGEEQVREDEGTYPGDSVEFLPTGEQTCINLGWRHGNWYCDCTLDELTIFGYALEAQQVSERYVEHRGS